MTEKWITPSLFKCASSPQASEYDVASGWGEINDARSMLERHWDTFVTADDFKYLASIGINTVRLPIGHWSLGSLYCQGTPYEGVSDVYANSWSRVVRAINWAGENGIGVLVDLHGGPGSQNGQLCLLFHRSSIGSSTPLRPTALWHINWRSQSLHGPSFDSENHGRLDFPRSTAGASHKCRRHGTLERTHEHTSAG